MKRLKNGLEKKVDRTPSLGVMTHWNLSLPGFLVVDAEDEDEDMAPGDLSLSLTRRPPSSGEHNKASGVEWSGDHKSRRRRRGSLLLLLLLLPEGGGWKAASFPSSFPRTENFLSSLRSGPSGLVAFASEKTGIGSPLFLPDWLLLLLPLLQSADG